MPDGTGYAASATGTGGPVAFSTALMRSGRRHHSTRCIRDPHRLHLRTSIAKTLASNAAQESRRCLPFSAVADVPADADDDGLPQQPSTGSALGTIALLNLALGANTP